MNKQWFGITFGGETAGAQLLEFLNKNNIRPGDWQAVSTPVNSGRLIEIVYYSENELK
ncbi:MAG: hypothetical protein RLY57_570 [Candidatus Parcubacteria bacterium]|jgi:ABC-type nitrate/sulfonate/bicarbonate transport system substrate-binding protein